MDKIKLFTKEKRQLSKKTIDNNFNFIGSTFDYLTNNKKLRFTNEKNVAVTLDKYGIAIITNPTIYLKESNLHQINRQELKEFKERFEDDLSINTNNYSLTGLDYNVNIITKYPPKCYLSIFRILPKYDKNIFKNKEGLTFINSCKTVSIYDKLKQMEKQGLLIPMANIDDYIMRIELGINRKMQQTTKSLASINSLNDLLITDNYINVINELERSYNKIGKTPLQKFTSMNKPLGMSYDDFAMIYYVNEIGGMSPFMDQLDLEYKIGTLSYKQFYTKKVKVYRLWELYSSTARDHHDLLKEVDKKVQDKLAQCKELAFD